MDRIEWYFNNTRLRYAVAPCKHSLLPSGTSSNEALHAEINRWFRAVRMMHQATLCLKLQILTLAKLLSHSSAMFSPTTRQMSPAVVLSRVTNTPLWTPNAWLEWCRELAGVQKVHKADLKLDRERQSQVETLRNWTLKRPAAAPRSFPRKRTAFTLKRTGSLITGGVKHTVFKRPRTCERSSALRRPAAA